MAKTPYNAGLPDQGPAFSATPTQPPTYLTSGSGNFAPKATTQWMKVTLLGGGAGGNSTSSPSTVCSGGNAALPVTHWVKKTKARYAYAIGAGGVGVNAGAGGDGGDTTFDTLTAYGARSAALNPAQVSNSGGLANGENSPYGKGGAWGSGNANGYGAGGGGTSGGSSTGGNASGGLIIIEEY
jgi:hypothetical protein